MGISAGVQAAPDPIATVDLTDWVTHTFFPWSDCKLPQQARNLPPPPRQHGSLGLVLESWNLSTAGLPPAVTHTIQSARAFPTPLHCVVINGQFSFRICVLWERSLLFSVQWESHSAFYRIRWIRAKPFSAIKVYLAAISACHMGFGDKPAGQPPHVCHFLKGTHCKRPVSRPLVPLWDLSLVMVALCYHPFEPLLNLMK